MFRQNKKHSKKRLDSIKNKWFQGKYGCKAETMVCIYTNTMLNRKYFSLV